MALHDSLSGVLFARRRRGVKLPDHGAVLRPSTPAARLRPRPRPTGLAGTSSRAGRHQPLRWPITAWAAGGSAGIAGRGRARTLAREWAETAAQAFAEGADIADALAARFDPLLGDIDPAHKEKLDIMNGVHSNAAGFRRWLEGQQPAAG